MRNGKSLTLFASSFFEKNKPHSLQTFATERGRGVLDSDTVIWMNEGETNAVH